LFLRTPALPRAKSELGAPEILPKS